MILLLMQLGKLTTGCIINLKGRELVVNSEKYNNDINYQITINKALEAFKIEKR